MTDIQRLTKVLEISGCKNLNQLASALDINSQVLYDIKREKCGISKLLALKIQEKFPSISDEWLLEGTGEMATGDNVTSVGDNNANGRDSKVVVGGGKAIEKLVEEIGKQRESKDAMFERLMRQQDRLISMLEAKYGTK